MSDRLIDRVLADPDASRQLLARVTRMEYAGPVTVTLKGEPVTVHVTPARKVCNRLVRCR